MTPAQIKRASDGYLAMFGEPLDSDTIELVRHVKTLEGLDAIEEELSAGQFDCLAWELDGP